MKGLPLCGINSISVPSRGAWSIGWSACFPGRLVGWRVTNLRPLQADSRGLALSPGFQFVAELLPFIQGRHPGLLHGGDVHKHILRTVIRLDEAVAFLSVEPFDRARCHGTSPCWFL